MSRLIRGSCSCRRCLPALAGAGAATHPMPCGVPGGVVSAEELSGAIADAMQDGYERSSRDMDDKLRGLYKHAGIVEGSGTLAFQQCK